jgi:hypothetical protein
LRIHERIIETGIWTRRDLRADGPEKKKVENAEPKIKEGTHDPSAAEPECGTERSLF